MNGMPTKPTSEEEMQKPLRERAMSTEWKIRLEAYKEINELFK